MAPSQCFQFSNLTLHRYTSDHKENYYDSQSSSRAKVLQSKNTEAMSSMSDPSSINVAEILRELQEERCLRKKEQDLRKKEQDLRKKEQDLRKKEQDLRKEAQDREKKAMQQFEHQNGPLQTGEYLKECHMAEKNFNMTTCW
ncbi:hypothetical protein E4U59_007904 [Claviceps monticola]|nr:hypothetical protein E4U59_007904 [Claviceps monticola]